MEVRVYLNMDAYGKRKYVYCRRVENFVIDQNPFTILYKSLKLLYGDSCIVEFLCV